MPEGVKVMKNYTVEQKIESFENDGMVIKSVKTVDGEVYLFEDYEYDLDLVVEVEVVDLQDYEENGFDVEGLYAKWIVL